MNAFAARPAKEIERILEEAEDVLGSYATDDDAVALEVPALLVTARKR